MSEGNELQRLEIFVTKLLEEFDGLRKNKEQLEKNKEQLEKELTKKNAVIEELNDQVAMQQLEREEVGLRVTRIVSQFEDWERELSEEEVVQELVSEEQQLEQEIADAEKQVQERELFSSGALYNKG